MFQFRFPKRRPNPDVDARALIREAALLLPSPARRKFLTGAVGLGTITMLTGCEVTDGVSAENALRVISRFNDRVQAALFDPLKLAPSYDPSLITRPFPFNAFYAEDEVPEIEEADYRLEIGGMVSEKRSWTLAEIAALPKQTQVTQHICIEGWSAIGKFSGVPLRHFLERVGADQNAAYVEFRCDDGYSTSLDMPTALHPQTQLTLELNEETLPKRNGYPIKVRVPTKLGFKNPKHITEMIVTNEYKDGFWEAYGYNWFSGL
jgi:DMSO/TMAO reductase YedYZ molybdopterin-dependent catalytic subunit